MSPPLLPCYLLFRSTSKHKGFLICRVQGNVDPMVLFAPEQEIRDTVRRCIAEGGEGHILNVGHGVAQGTPEENVGLFCQMAHESGALKKELVAA